jgi:hypothetical protein
LMPIMRRSKGSEERACKAVNPNLGLSSVVIFSSKKIESRGSK